MQEIIEIQKFQLKKKKKIHSISKKQKDKFMTSSSSKTMIEAWQFKFELKNKEYKSKTKFFQTWKPRIEIKTINSQERSEAKHDFPIKKAGKNNHSSEDWRPALQTLLAYSSQCKSISNTTITFTSTPALSAFFNFMGRRCWLPSCRQIGSCRRCRRTCIGLTPRLHCHQPM